jgi:DNA-binding MarR family transcriptional regulator
MYEAGGAGGLESISYEIAVDVAQIVAGSPGGEAAAARTAAAAGLRARLPLDAASALEAETLLDGVQLLLLEAEGIAPVLLEPLLIRLGAMAEARGVPLIATVTQAQIDIALGLLPASAVLQCAPSDVDRLGTVLSVRREPVVRLHDGMRDQEAMRMRRFHEEVARIADSLSRLARNEVPERSASVRNETMAFRMDTETVESDPVEIRRVIRARRMRAEFFEGDLFADPAWDMLLDLYAAELEHRQISVSSLCIAAAVPPTTALRWIGTLNEAGLFDRKADPSDRRRAYIALSESARHGMERYVAAVKRAGLSLV